MMTPIANTPPAIAPAESGDVRGEAADFAATLESTLGDTQAPETRTRPAATRDGGEPPQSQGWVAFTPAFDLWTLDGPSTAQDAAGDDTAQTLDVPGDEWWGEIPVDELLLAAPQANTTRSAEVVDLAGVRRLREAAAAGAAGEGIAGETGEPRAGATPVSASRPTMASGRALPTPVAPGVGVDTTSDAPAAFGESLPDAAIAPEATMRVGEHAATGRDRSRLSDDVPQMDAEVQAPAVGSAASHSQVDAVAIEPEAPATPRGRGRGRPSRAADVLPFAPGRRAVPTRAETSAGGSSDLGRQPGTAFGPAVPTAPGPARADGGASPTVFHLPVAAARAVNAPTLSSIASIVPPAGVHADDLENIRNLVQAIRVTARSGGWEATVRLRPEHLGEVTIAVRVDGTTVSATVNAEAANVRSWLQLQEESVRNGLADHGLTLDKFQVERDGRQQREARDEAREQQRRPRRPVAGQQQFEIVV